MQLMNFFVEVECTDNEKFEILSAYGHRTRFSGTKDRTIG
jgi:hypothetical protein